MRTAGPGTTATFSADSVLAAPPGSDQSFSFRSPSRLRMGSLRLHIWPPMPEVKPRSWTSAYSLVFALSKNFFCVRHSATACASASVNMNGSMEIWISGARRWMKAFMMTAESVTPCVVAS